MPIASKAEQEAFEAAEKAVDGEGRPAPQADGRDRGPVPQGAAGARRRRCSRPPSGRCMAIPEKERTPAQKRLAEGLKTTLEGHLGGRRRGRRRKNPADHAERERLKRAIHDDRADPAPPARPGAWRWSTRSRRPPRRSSLAGATSKTRGPQGRAAAARRRPRLAGGGRRSRERSCRPRRPPAGARALAQWLDPARQPADGPGDRQPALAAPFRPGDRRHAQRLRRPGRGPDASRAARLAGHRAGRAGLAAQADPPPDGHLGDLPAVVVRQPTPRSRPPTTPRTRCSGG